MSKERLESFNKAFSDAIKEANERESPTSADRHHPKSVKNIPRNATRAARRKAHAIGKYVGESVWSGVSRGLSGLSRGSKKLYELSKAHYPSVREKSVLAASSAARLGVKGVRLGLKGTRSAASLGLKGTRKAASFAWNGAKYLTSNVAVPVLNRSGIGDDLKFVKNAVYELARP